MQKSINGVYDERKQTHFSKTGASLIRELLFCPMPIPDLSEIICNNVAWLVFVLSWIDYLVST